MAISDLKHVFVLMMENRSYDHLFGAIPLQGVDLSGFPTTAEGVASGAFENFDRANVRYQNSTPAPLRMPADPPHEFDDVVLQLLGENQDPPFNYFVKPITSSGFIKSYANGAGQNQLGDILKSFTPDQIPYLSQLAREYCVCDNWYSSLPGPTVPNRFFLHAGTSNGNPKSPPDLRVIAGEFIDQFSFANGNIFKRIKEQTNLQFRIYRGDSLPFSTMIDGVDYEDDTTPFDAKQFADDCDAPNLPAFIFIEPSYGIFDKFRSGNSQHPMADIQNGDRLIKDVYDAISTSACWPKSALIITYDEHGGFFDHKIPPKCAAPGDVQNKYDFNFTQLGVRVPAVIVSPLLVQRNLIDHTVYDHTSVLATLRSVFPQIGAFTMRDRMANPLTRLFDGPPKSQTALRLVEAALPLAGPAPLAALTDDAAPLEHAEIAALRIAAGVHHRVGKTSKAKVALAISDLKTKGDARRYFREIDALVKTRTNPSPKRKAKKRLPKKTTKPLKRRRSP